MVKITGMLKESSTGVMDRLLRTIHVLNSMGRKLPFVVGTPVDNGQGWVEIGVVKNPWKEEG